MGIPTEGFTDALANVIRDIGVSGEGHPDFQPPLPLDHHAQGILRRKPTASNGVRFFQPASAVLTKPLGDRLPNPLTDMDYYADAGRNAYRPQWTLATLVERGCQYEGGYVVTRVADGSVTARSLGSGQEHTWTADAVILAAGAVNTGRILLQSRNFVNRPVPIIVKPHDFIVCADWRSLGKPGPRNRVSFCQLVGLDPTQGPDGLPSACAQLYSYRSLMLFRLLSSVPLPTPIALQALALLSPTLLIADVRYPGRKTDSHSIAVDRDGHLEFTGKPGPIEGQTTARSRIRSALREAGVLPVKTVIAGVGTSSHYAGTVPVSDDPKDILRCNADGKVHGFDNVFVADASMFRCLPPLPHTLTLMANAYRIGTSLTRLPS